MSIKSQHTCEMTCDLCDKVYYEGPMKMKYGVEVRRPPTDSITIEFTSVDEVTLDLCPTCFANARKEILGAIGNRDGGALANDTIQISLSPGWNRQ